MLALLALAMNLRTDPFDAASIGASVPGATAVRIPALKILSSGRTLVACEARPSPHSDEGRIALVLRASEDRGGTWSEPVTLASEAGFNYRNPCLGQTRGGRVVLLFNSRSEHANEMAMHRGTTKEAMRAYVRTSDDGGRTWSKIREITGEVRPPDYRYACFGPSRIVTLPSGRLVAAMNGSAPGREPTGVPTDVWLVTSDDNGKTWRRGASTDRVRKDGKWGDNETTLETLADGTLLASIRDASGGSYRYLATSRDGGETFATYGPRAEWVANPCQGGLARVGRDTVYATLTGEPGKGKFPDRRRLSLYRSDDGGLTWSSPEVLVPGALGYSQMEAYPDGEIALVYEDGAPVRGLKFALLSPRDGVD